MFLPTLLSIFQHDLQQLADEINLYETEADLWRVPTGISNSAGNLTLHLIGNLNHFIGATLGQSGYVRNRDLEFADKYVARATMLEQIERTKEVVTQTLTNLPEEGLNEPFPLMKHEQNRSTTFMLLHILAHLNYHLGQINYHRRLLKATEVSN